jgi:hypothetical protein
VKKEESKAAVDRMLKKYWKAPAGEVDDDGNFDDRYERSVWGRWMSGSVVITRLDSHCFLSAIGLTRHCFRGN